MSENPTAKRAVVYLRVSTLEQTQTATDDKGYSIHGQETACIRKAEELGATIVDTYIERAESAKTANRPQLQKMLARIRDGQDVDLLIVYKIDRFARNRIEDGIMIAELRSHGVELVSVTENIDNTPAGRLMHGVLATIAEYEVANLGTRSSMGMAQKARMGGTPGRAPVGYLNVREQIPGGGEHRTIAIDPNTAPHVQWAFRTYAAGEINVKELTELLAARGLLGRPHRRNDVPKPLSTSMVGRLLRNPYYTGKVPYKGDIYPGNHEPLVSQQLWDDVQDIMDDKNTSGIRRRVHDHPLKGNLTCKRCDTSMYLAMAKNRHGSVYPYFFCRGRRDGFCDQPYINVETIVDQVSDYYRTTLAIPEGSAQRLEEHLNAELELLQAENSDAIQRETKTLARLKDKRRKLLHLYYDDQLTEDLYKDEQRDLDHQERAARRRLATAETSLGSVIETAVQATQILESWGSIVDTASIRLQRQFHWAFYDTIYVDTNHIDPAAQQHTTALLDAITTVTSTSTGDTIVTAELPPRPTPTTDIDPDTKEPELVLASSGSNTSLLVPRTGFEPVLPP